MTDTQPVKRDRVRKLDLYEKQLWRSHECAGVMGISRTFFNQLKRDGRVPAPLDIFPGTPVWRSVEMLAWFGAGMPDPHDWTYTPQKLENIDQLLKRKSRELASVEQELAQKSSLLDDLTSTIEPADEHALTEHDQTPRVQPVGDAVKAGITAMVQATTR
jgi:predicted DNA-binding transcriptional regulator AlpA